MNRLLSLIRKDLILGIKDVYIILELVFAILITAMVLTIIPKLAEQEQAVFIYDETGMMAGMADLAGEEAQKQSQQLFVDTPEEIVKGMTKNRNAMGMILRNGEEGTIMTELLTQPYTTESMVRYFEVILADLFAMMKPPAGIYPPEVLQSVRVVSLQENRGASIPFNKRLLPLIMTIMVGMMGFFTMMSVIGQERSDLTLRAYKVTPARLWEFLLSKHLVLLLVGFCTFSIMYLPVLGFVGYFKALLIIIPAIVFGSAIGVLLGSFFDNPMSSLGWIFLIMVFYSLPAISLFAPVFAPEWIKFIPSYYLLFGLQEAMFPDGYSNVFPISVAVLVILAALFTPFSSWIFNKQIRKEA